VKTWWRRSSMQRGVPSQRLRRPPPPEFVSAVYFGIVEVPVGYGYYCQWCTLGIKL
jgi:hypothetical protein